MKTKHLAFKMEYPGIAKALITQVQISVAGSTTMMNSTSFLDVYALWDTGATNSVIIPELARHLGLKPISKTIVRGVNSEEEANVYLVDLILPNKVLFKDVLITESAFVGADILIGMNIIQMGDFAISNAKGKTRFSFCIPPHDNPICLYEKSEKVNKRK
ncbi:retroviral-like aspartic protease family protein [bacterium]|nr:retroviral-like aspartic protease family protein [bacterium]